MRFLLLIFLFIILVIFYPVADLYQVKNGYAYYDLNKKDFILVNKRPKHWLSLKEISPHIKNAIIVSEDWDFYSHYGIDFYQLKNATMDYWQGVRARGASTITQQLVKNLILYPEKTFFRKIYEIFLALLTETFISKSKILRSGI